jgi:hypothetical protein
MTTSRKSYYTKRGADCWITFQVRQIKTGLLLEALTRIAQVKPPEGYSTPIMELAWVAGHAEMQTQAKNIINALIEESNRATAENDKRTAGAYCATDRSVSDREV